MLLRHLRTAHQATIARKRSAQKSCFRCVKKKLKCDRSQPCVPCTKSSTLCKYPDDEDSVDSDGPDGKAESPAETSPQFLEQQQQHYHNGTFQSPESYQHQSEPHIGPVQGASSLLVHSGQGMVAAQNFNGNAPFFPPAPQSHSMEMISPEIVCFPNTSPTTAGTEFSHPMMQFDGYLPGDFNFMPSNSAPRIVGMVEGGVDWLNLELDSPNNGDLQAQYQNGSMQSVYPPPSMPTGLDEALQNRQQQSIPAQLMPIRNQESKGVSIKSAESQAVAQQWPFDHTRNPETQNCRLPPLRDILQGSADNGSIIKSLIQLMSAPYLPEMDLSHDVNMVSAMDLLKNSLELYFSEFHAVLPLVHVPTFQMTKVPTVTLAAMACIGAMYSDDQHGTEQSWSLSEICIQMIAWLVSINQWFVRKHC